MVCSRREKEKLRRQRKLLAKEKDVLKRQLAQRCVCPRLMLRRLMLRRLERMELRESQKSNNAISSSVTPSSSHSRRCPSGAGARSNPATRCGAMPTAANPLQTSYTGWPAATPSSRSTLCGRAAAAAAAAAVQWTTQKRTGEGSSVSWRSVEIYRWLCPQACRATAANAGRCELIFAFP
eukprot:SAG11_NODE_1544_length_4716_cov_3.012995_6_plen_180_part_00